MKEFDGNKVKQALMTKDLLIKLKDQIISDENDEWTICDINSEFATILSTSDNQKTKIQINAFWHKQFFISENELISVIEDSYTDLDHLEKEIQTILNKYNIPISAVPLFEHQKKILKILKAWEKFEVPDKNIPNIDYAKELYKIVNKGELLSKKFADYFLIWMKSDERYNDDGTLRRISPDLRLYAAVVLRYARRIDESIKVSNFIDEKYSLVAAASKKMIAMISCDRGAAFMDKFCQSGKQDLSLLEQAEKNLKRAYANECSIEEKKENLAGLDSKNKISIEIKNAYGRLHSLKT